MPCDWPCSAVHVETHALGLPFYELTSLVLRFGICEYQKHVDKKKLTTMSALFIGRKILISNLKWAKFLMDDSRPNKERVLSERIKLKEKGVKLYDK